MHWNQITRSLSGRLIPSVGSSIAAPPALHQDMVLYAIRELIENHQYVFATDDEGRIVGVVPCRRIRERLESKNDRERMRWESMHLGALIDAEVSTAPCSRRTTIADGLDCVAVMEDDELVAIAVSDDVFLSLRRLEPTLAAARCDPLTGLMNRLGYERRLAEEWARATRTGTSIGVIVLDLDEFKQINDRFGHPAGDEVLRCVGSILENTLRSYDVVARYGGDEFVALCLGCRPGDIEIPILRIQQQLTNCSIDYGAESLQVSAAIGAAVRHHQFDQSDPADLFAAADDCVYHSKNRCGPPCVVEYTANAISIPRAVHTQQMHASLARESLLVEIP